MEEQELKPLPQEDIKWFLEAFRGVVQHNPLVDGFTINEQDGLIYFGKFVLGMMEHVYETIASDTYYMGYTIQGCDDDGEADGSILDTYWNKYNIVNAGIQLMISMCITEDDGYPPQELVTKIEYV